jgi:hypothetical protein
LAFVCHPSFSNLSAIDFSEYLLKVLRGLMDKHFMAVKKPIIEIIKKGGHETRLGVQLQPSG